MNNIDILFLGGESEPAQRGVGVSQAFLTDVCGNKESASHYVPEETKGPNHVTSLPDCMFRAEDMLSLDTDLPDSLSASLFYEDDILTYDQEQNFVNNDEKCKTKFGEKPECKTVQDKVRNCNNVSWGP